MARKIVRIGIVALIAGTALAAGLPAHASTNVGQGDEIVVTYYSNAQETTVVGERAYGSCGIEQIGTITAYYSVNEYLCPA